MKSEGLNGRRQYTHPREIEATLAYLSWLWGHGNRLTYTTYLKHIVWC